MKIYIHHISTAILFSITCASTFVCTMREIISPIIKPTHVEFLHSNKVAIGGSNGLAFVQLFTKRYSHHQPTKTIQYLCVNKPRTKLAVSFQEIITVYNTDTEKLEWKFNTGNNLDYTPITFNSQKDDELFACIYGKYLSRLCNGEHVARSEKILNIKPFSQIACHPLCIKILYFRECMQDSVVLQSYSNPNDNPMLDIAPFINIEICKNGNYLLTNLLNNSAQLTISDFRSPPIASTFDKKSPNKNYVTYSLHPSGKYVVELQNMEDNCTLQYFDCEKVVEPNFDINSSIKTAELDIPKKSSLYNTAEKRKETLEKRLAFSPNGHSLLIAFTNKCFIHSVFLDLNYIEEDKNKLRYLIFALNNHDLKLMKTLPSEIIAIIKQLLITIHQSEHLI